MEQLEVGGGESEAGCGYINKGCYILGDRETTLWLLLNTFSVVHTPHEEMFSRIMN